MLIPLGVAPEESNSAASMIIGEFYHAFHILVYQLARSDCRGGACNISNNAKYGMALCVYGILVYPQLLWHWPSQRHRFASSARFLGTTGSKRCTVSLKM